MLGLDYVSAVVEYVAKELLVSTCQAVGQIAGLAHGEQAFLPPVDDVGAPALDKVPGQPFAQAPTLALPNVIDGGEFRLQQAEQVVERRLIAGVGCRS